METHISYTEKGSRSDPKNYRHHLPFIYLQIKYIQDIWALSTNHIISEEQKVGMNRSLGCKEQLIIDNSFQNIPTSKSLPLAYVILITLKVLEIYKVHNNVKTLIFHDEMDHPFQAKSLLQKEFPRVTPNFSMVYNGTQPLVHPIR